MIVFKSKLVGVVNSEWPHRLWSISINGVYFDFKTGMGIKGEPKEKEVLECLFSDYRAGLLNFDDFCSEFDYSEDSLKAFDTYRACIESGKKLKKALGKSFYQMEKELNES